ncbi:small ribosomal subunit protein uS9-like [Ylistrum balloti]|uniref:small ribosomal subunit protein uS9-like n=1 Tax=Ylistrum balloti TaxID=509963 RepID=UPI002905E988|nr:small ribosomal subunit protein uS9-like [Ylistrum balloti]
MEKRQFFAVGKRKTSIARIFIQRGSGTISVNKKKTLDTQLKRPELIKKALLPLAVTKQDSLWDLKINVSGGGLTGQAGAISHGLARTLIKTDPELRPALKKNNLLTRDSRMVERKKYGKRGARRSFQFSKR